MISGNESDVALHAVVDIDFENTKIEKKCLLAQVNATIEFK